MGCSASFVAHSRPVQRGPADPRAAPQQDPRKLLFKSHFNTHRHTLDCTLRCHCADTINAACQKYLCALAHTFTCAPAEPFVCDVVIEEHKSEE